jgi:hypothetical protein
MHNNHKMTKHAEIRMRQRGLRVSDMRLLLKDASQVSPGAYLLTNQDAAREIAVHKSEIRRLERLKGCKVIVEQGFIVTCYRTGRKNQKRTLQYGRACK